MSAPPPYRRYEADESTHTRQHIGEEHLGASTEAQELYVAIQQRERELARERERHDSEIAQRRLEDRIQAREDMIQESIDRLARNRQFDLHRLERRVEELTGLVSLLNTRVLELTSPTAPRESVPTVYNSGRVFELGRQVSSLEAQNRALQDDIVRLTGQSQSGIQNSHSRFVHDARQSCMTESSQKSRITESKSEDIQMVLDKWKNQRRAGM